MASIRRRTADDYHALAATLGYRWIGPEVPNNRTLTTWECPKGHRWETCFSNLKQRHSGCNVCSKRASKTVSDYKALATERQLEWLGPVLPKNIYHKSRWKCLVCGQERNATYSAIRNTVRGCPLCSGLAKLTAGDYAAIAAACGLFWLGPMVKNNRRKTGWQCQRGHIWQTSYTHIQSGTGCPECVDMINGVRTSRPQRELAKRLGGQLNHPAGRYRIDIAIERGGIPIAVEYDAWYWHQKRTDNDRARDDFLLRNGWRILRIKSGQQLPDKHDLNAALKRLLAGSHYEELVLPDWK